MKTREEALALLHEYTEGESLRRHAYAVEAAMSRVRGKVWRRRREVGHHWPLARLDYEKYPSLDEHTVVGAKTSENADIRRTSSTRFRRTVTTALRATT